MKRILKISFPLLALLLIYVCFKFFSLVDLRPENSNHPNSFAKAKKLLHEMGKAHGIDSWDNIQIYNATYGDEFYGFLGKQSHPFKEQKIRFSLSYIPKSFNGQLKFLTGKDKGVIWGIQSGKTYQLNDNDEVSVIKNKDMKFWIPTYQYFIEFPSRIQEATALDYVGTKVINGIQTEGVLASWGTVNPQKEVDQYIIWIETSTKRIVKIEYTVREMYRFVSGAAYFQNYKTHHGLLLPSQFSVESNLLNEGYLHKMSIINFTPNQVDKNSLLPLK